MLSVRGIYENGQIHILEPLPYRKKAKIIVTLLDELSETEQPVHEKKPRPIGLAKEIFQVPKSFFDELPEDILAGFEGKTDEGNHFGEGDTIIFWKNQ